VKTYKQITGYKPAAATRKLVTLKNFGVGVL